MKYYINQFIARTGLQRPRCRRWGLAMLLLPLFALLANNAHAQRLVAGEYFYNTDPGTGKGTPISITATNAVNTNFSIPVGSLPAGFYQLFVRFKDSLNRWGLAEQRTLYINATTAQLKPLVPITNAEYFFDTDPGAGLGKPFTITSNDSLLITQGISTTGLAKGAHQLFVRFKDSLNNWGLAEQRTFFVDSTINTIPPLAPVVAAEYFFDTDPGTGHGVTIPVTKSNSVNLASINLNITEGIALGAHQLFVRFKDSLNRWGIAEQRTFYIDSTIAVAKLAPIVAGEYFIDTDPGTGKATPISTTKADSLNLTLQMASSTKPGSHQLFVRYKDSLNRWGIAEQRTFFVDSAIAAIPRPRIVAAEYFINTDSGVGRGTPIPIAKSDTLNQVLQLVMPGNLAAGTNYLYIRFKDSTGRWSIAEQRTLPAIVCKPNLGNDTALKICAGTATNITGIYAYKGYASASWNTPRPDSVGTGTYTLIVTSTGGCKDTAVVTITNYPKPNLGNDTTITISAGTGVTTNITTLYNTTGLTPQYTGTTTPQSVGAGTYNLIVADACGFKDTAVIVVRVYTPPPVITSVSPGYGGTGSLISIVGKYFLTATGVSFGNINATSFTVVNDSLITATLASGTNGNIAVKVTTVGGSATYNGFVFCTPVTPSVSLVANKPGTICANTKVTFTATPVNGGTAPFYAWYKNNVNFASNANNTYSDSLLKNGDSVWVVLSSNASCLAVNNAKSNVLVFTVNAQVTPAVTIAGNPVSPICTNNKVTFTATPANGGATPVYQWYKNNAVVGTNAATYADSLLKSNDSVWAVLTSNAGCATTPTAKSNVLKYTVNSATTASVSIAASATTVCQGTAVTFTATPVNGGTAPIYQWKRGGVNVGTNSTTYMDSLPVNGDSITVVLTTNVGCAVTPNVTSNSIKLVVNTKPNLGRDSSLYTCIGTVVNIKNIYSTTGLTTTWSTLRPDSITAPGTYTLIVASTAGCKDTSVVTVSNYPKPNLGKDTTVTICSGTTVNLNNIYNLTGLTAAWSKPKADSATAGVYTLIVTNSNGCKDTAVVTVGYYAKPNLGNDTTVVVSSSTATTDITKLYKTTGLTATYSTATPAAATQGNYTLIVTNSCGLKDTANIKVMVFVSGPVITALAPPTTYVGGTVNIYGKYFTGATVVSFGGVNATRFTVLYDSLITAVVGNGASGLVSVTTPGGTGTMAGFTICTGVTPSVSIAANIGSPICANTKVTFTATAVNGGTSPVYTWYKNNVVTGTIANTYTDSLLKNSDSVWVVLTSNAGCRVANTAKSNVLKYVVNAVVTPTVTVAANIASPVCVGTKVTFTATATNGGTAPVYQWYKNNAVVGTNAITYTDSLLKNSDSVWCVVTSNAGCLTTPSAKSNVLKYVVSLIRVPSVSITANTGASVCTGTSVVFTATSVNGGTAPFYQWKKNGVNVGTNTPSYTDTIPANGDTVVVLLTASGTCVVTTPVASNGIKLAVNSRPNLGKDTSIYTCPGTAANLTKVYTLTGLTPTWTITRPDSVTVNGSYTLIVANTFGCRDTAVITTGSYAKPNLGHDTTVYTCAGTLANLTGIYNTSSFKTAWSLTTPAAAPAGTYKLVVTNSTGCMDTAQVTVSNFAKPNLGNDTTVYTCTGTARNLNYVYNLTALYPTWSTTRPDSAVAGVYTLYVNNSLGCKDTAVITVSNYPKPNLGKDTVLYTCIGTARNLSAVYNLTGLTPTWSTARPDSVVAGSYTLIVTNSTGCKDTAVITVTNYAKPNLGKDTSVSVCPGVAVNMQLLYNLTGLSPKWSAARPDSVTAPGTYTLTVTNSSGCRDTALINIFNYPKPNLGRDTTVATCLGTAANLTKVYNLTGLTPIWTITRPDSVVTAGAYTLNVKNVLGCRDTAIITLVTPAPPAKPIIKVGGSTTFCLGDSLALNTNPLVGALQWYRNGAAIRQATAGLYQVKLTGRYKVSLTTNAVCTVMSDSVIVTVTQVPTPTITLVNDTLVSSSATGNQWYEAGVLIPGATGQKFAPVNIDQYTVQVTSGTCKSPMSAPYLYMAGTPAKIRKKVVINNGSATLYPNPASDAAHLQLSGFSGGVAATITDLTGKLVWQQDKLTNGSYTLPLSNLASGVYLVTVKDRTNTITIKLVKAK